MTEISPTPSAMKNATDLCRPATTMNPAYAAAELNGRSAEVLRDPSLGTRAFNARYVNEFHDTEAV